MLVYYKDKVTSSKPGPAKVFKKRNTTMSINQLMNKPEESLLKTLDFNNRAHKVVHFLLAKCMPMFCLLFVLIYIFAAIVYYNQEVKDKQKPELPDIPGNSKPGGL